MQNEEKILVALYAEAIHCGNFNEVNRTTMGMESREFGWALYILQMRGLIAGCAFQPPAPGSAENLMGVIRDALILTPEGFRRAEEHFCGSTERKFHKIWGFLRDAGCQIFAEIVMRWME